MMFTKAVAALFLSALAQTGMTYAAPLEKRDVYSPPVLYPHTGTVWYSGQTHNVTWDNSNPPTSISNRAFILLRQGNSELPVVLAHDFDLRAGRVEVEVPDVITGNFSIVLFGDSGNWSEDFLINGPIDF
ncbi:uncharacterized protein PHACADRAFT_253270 [Phanerochaete carnosa HHB-10118-sp]|uniref:Uncharacterized protein n=1 Tax=Phanerochaete carnosa (strain HHB-10118-sp) TaxID=650164 RepID=K5V182_PHACS|nr:uncharacterized protein PHACADRAFT_253270 [Phanerochaete carnosa HHB-10118-sp]EKM56246.1 hypothetical protein PHACADRAFT_253270 [Phanerochaete carnosa HHB-10118-sp]